MAVITKDLGAVSSYALAVENGYTGTEQEWIALISSTTTSAQTAVDAKDAALVAKTAAETAATQAAASATAAAGSASGASGSATAAAESATAAAGSATSAGSSATAAAGSASSASSSATAASGSASAASGSASSAATAKTAAEAAQAGAEAAQAAAEAVLESIPEDYSELSDDVSSLLSQITNVDTIIDNYLVESNKIYRQSSFTVGSAGQTYQRKTFYTLEKTFTVGERYTFTCDSVVGNTSVPIRYELYAGDTKIRDGAGAQTVNLEIGASDITADVDKAVFFVYASTSTAQERECVVTNPVVYEGWTTTETFTYCENFDDEVNRVIGQSVPDISPVQTLSLGTLEDGFINSESGAAMSADTYKRTGFIHVQADKLKVAITFSVSAVGFAFYDSRKKYISGFDYTGYNVGDLKEVSVPENAYYFRYCAINPNVPQMQVLIPNYANAVSRIDTNPCFYNASSECRAFKKILCIGDSLTEGAFDYKEGGVTKEFNAPEYSYPTFLKAMTGRDTTNAGDAGETTVSWYELHGQEDFSGHDACIIMLGRNDYVSGRETTSEQRATAFANIISKVRSDNPQISIFLSTLINYYKGSDAETMNEDIRTAATANSCYLLDIAAYGRMVLADDAYSHCTAEGYCTLAEYFFRYISYIMHNNYTAFKTIQFVGTNRSFS